MKTESNSKAFILRTIIVCFIFSTSGLSQQGWHQGETWLKWSHSTRQAYVIGYVVGYTDGGYEARRQTKACNLDKQPAASTSLGRPNFSGNVDDFVNKITDFYRRYPAYRDLAINDILDLLGKGVGADQIPQQPLMRHAPPQTR